MNFLKRLLCLMGVIALLGLLMLVVDTAKSTTVLRAYDTTGIPGDVATSLALDAGGNLSVGGNISATVVRGGTLVITNTITSINGVNTSGMGVPIIFSEIALPGTTSSSGPTIAFSPAGPTQWRVSGYIETTTSGSAGTVTITVGWSDDGGAKTFTSPSVALTAVGNTGYASFSTFMRVANLANMTYQISVVGNVGATFSVYILYERLF